VRFARESAPLPVTSMAEICGPYGGQSQRFRGRERGVVGGRNKTSNHRARHIVVSGRVDVAVLELCHTFEARDSVPDSRSGTIFPWIGGRGRGISLGRPQDPRDKFI
jgi:hypothetical protein